MIALHLYNHEPMIFSASAATAGGHESVRYIPGPSLWGAALARLYAAGAADTIKALWDGRVRMSPGFPLTHTRCPAFPMPQALVEPKHEKGGVVGARLTGKAWNTLFGPLKNDKGEIQKNDEGEIQTEPISGRDFLAGDGSVARPKSGERGKAAVSEGDRRVEIAQFFQYEYLDAGQNWLAFVDCDEGCADHAEGVVAALEAGRLRLGRSKRREFGGDVKVTRVALTDDPRVAKDRVVIEDGISRLVLWCLSDLALLDEYGAPNLAPVLSDLLPGAKKKALDAERSLIATRRYWPHNLHLGARDRELAVIAAGSVLVYRVDDKVPLDRLRQGVGLYRERGFGLLWPNPKLLAVEEPIKGIVSPEKAGQIKVPTSVAAATPVLGDGEVAGRASLIASVAARAGALRDAKAIAQATDEIANRFGTAVANAEKRGDPIPAASQWTLLADAALNAASVEALRSRLPDLIQGPRNADWQALRGVVEGTINNRPRPIAAARDDAFLKALSRAAQAVAKRMRRAA
jgi:hypothetical protein